MKRTKHGERWNAARPNHLWRLDYVHRDIDKADARTLILLDDCSWYLTVHNVSEAERADFVIDPFDDAAERRGKPEMVLHDNGAASWSWRRWIPSASMVRRDCSSPSRSGSTRASDRKDLRVTIGGRPMDRCAESGQAPRGTVLGDVRTREHELD